MCGTLKSSRKYLRGNVLHRNGRVTALLAGQPRSKRIARPGRVVSRVCRYQTRQYLNGIAFGNVIAWTNTARETLGRIWTERNELTDGRSNGDGRNLT